MRYLQLMILVSSCIFFGTPVFADLCCPSGCVPSGYGNGCWHIGTNNSCGAGSICGGASSGSGGGGGTGGGGVFPQRAPCSVWYQTQQNRDDATNQCVTVLTTNAQFWGCLFEDNAGRAEDKDWFSCAGRRPLAKQCRARCAALPNLSNLQRARMAVANNVRRYGGSTYGSARVDLCGPRLKTSFFNRRALRAASRQCKDPKARVVKFNVRFGQSDIRYH